ncbi:MAG: 4-hydroxythreonine-4-phosphate dehydrogenase PdxA [Longimicrobiales bacterium]
MFRPRIAVTLGDPRGIGPEVADRALTRLAAGATAADYEIVLPDGSVPVAQYSRAMSDGDAGVASARSLEAAVSGALSGRFHAVVTAPVHKPSLHAAGWDVPGQTEMLARLTRSHPVGMLMAAERTRLGGPLRVLLATTHLALRDVPDAVTESLLVEQGKLLHDSLRRDWRIPTPRVALCALNPHASDGGLFGDEEALTLAPAVAKLRAAGVHIDGPLPADTVFSRALAGSYDAVIAPYHDVGMAAFKTVSFGTGVNVTLGLPFVRTSPDHGTAFDIAGTGRADESSMVEALELASRLAHARFDTGSHDV